MKKLLLLLGVLAVAFSCSQYDDQWIKDEFTDIENRLNELQKKCEKLNGEISTIQNILKVIQENDFVTDVKPIESEGRVIGYEIHFSKNKTITLYHGTDGVDGYTPQIGVKQDSEGVYCWTLDGEWLLDNEGNRIPATGEDGAPGAPGVDGLPGADGVDGAPGQDGISPQLKIEDGYWYVSYDGGAFWSKLDKAVGDDGKDGVDGLSYFKEVAHDDEYVYITLNDGTTLKMQKVSALNLSVEISRDIPCGPGCILQIPYMLSGVTASAEVITISEGAWNASVTQLNSTSGYITVQAPAVIDDSQILVVASDSRKTVMKTLSFAEGVISADGTFSLSDNGGELSIDVSTNYDYEVTANASWITSIETRSVRNEKIIITYQPLPSGTVTRSAEISITDKYAGTVKTITLVQGSPISISENRLDMIVGDETSLSASSMLGHTEFLWFSSDSDVVRVDEAGNLIAITAGTVIITAMTRDYMYSADCTVSVCRMEDLITTEFGSATDVTYQNGMVGAGTKLSWYITNNSSYDILVTALQVNDSATGYQGNKMSVNETLKPGEYTGWRVTLGGNYYSPSCKFYFTYRGKEYTQECGSIFN